MSEPIKIIVTAETADAAAKLQAFLAQTNTGFKQVEETAHGASNALGQNRMAFMELGHSARATAEGLAFGMNPMRIAMLEAPRLTQAFGEMSSEMRTKLLSFLPVIGGVSAALALGATAWHYYGESITNPTKRAKELADALDKIPDLLQKIQVAQRAGDISEPMAQKFQDMLTRATKLYNVSTVADAFGGHAGTFHPGGTMFGEAVPNLTTDPSNRNTRTGQIIGQRQPANEADIAAYVQYQMKHEGATDANDKTKMADQAAVELQEKELQLKRDSEISTQRTIDRLKDRNEVELRHMAVLKEEQQAGGKWGPDQESQYQTAIKNSQLALQQSIQVERDRADEEWQSKAQKVATDIAEVQRKIKETEAKLAKENLQRTNDEIRAEEEAAGSQRGELIKQEYDKRIQAANDALKIGGVDEEEYTHLVAEATHERTEAEKEYRAALTRSIELKHQAAVADIEAKIAAVQGAPDATKEDKDARVATLLESLYAVNQAYITSLGIEEAQTRDTNQRLELETKISEQKKLQAGLKNQIDIKSDDTFSGQFSAQWTQLASKVGDLQRDLASVAMSPLIGLQSGLDNAFNKLFEKGETARQFFGQVAMGMYQAFTRALSNMLADLVTHLAMVALKEIASQLGITAIHTAGTQARVAVHAGGEGQMTLATMVGSLARQAWHLAETVFHGIMVAMRVAAHVAGEILCTIITGAQTALRAMYHAIVAAIAAMESEASVPVVGVVLGIAAAAAIMAAAVGMMGGFAGGGPVNGPGSATSDSIPARLSNGEFVMSAGAVQRFGAENLHAINQGNVNYRNNGGASADAGSGGGGTTQHRTDNFIYFDSSAMMNHLQKSDAHEKLIVDIMGRNIHKFRS